MMKFTKSRVFIIFIILTISFLYWSLYRKIEYNRYNRDNDISRIFNDISSIDNKLRSGIKCGVTKHGETFCELPKGQGLHINGANVPIWFSDTKSGIGNSNFLKNGTNHPVKNQSIIGNQETESINGVGNVKVKSYHTSNNFSYSKIHTHIVNVPEPEASII
jgi:hypothetical protein